MKKIIRSIRHTFFKGRDNALLYPHKLEMIGGKLVCPALIPSGSTIISGGVGNDVKFEMEMIRRKGVRVVGIDPTITALQYIEERKLKEPLVMENYVYLKKALSDTTDPIRLFYGENDGMSSVSSQHRDTVEGNYFICDAVTIPDLLKTYPDVSYIKIDIEGAEYAILDKMDKCSVPQISIEFHHHCSTEYTIARTIAMIQKIEKMGYDAIDYGSYFGRGRELPQYSAKWTDLNCELLFVKR